MTRPALLSPLVTKEIRSLLPIWLAVLAAIVANAVLNVGPFHGLGITAFFFGSAALGALSVGHEYRHGTMTLLLSQPAHRQHLFLVKLGVLAAMLLTIGAVAGAVVFPEVHVPTSERPWWVSLSVLFVLCIAPWLTMLCRSAIAGAVFTVGLPGGLVTVGQLLYIVTYRREPPDLDMAILWRGGMGLCVVGAVMGWRTFMRLEAIDGQGPVVGLPQWLLWSTASIAAAPPFTKRHAIWLLVKKELRLQQMALVVAGLYVLGWLTFVSLGPLGPHSSDISFVLTFFYGLLISLLIGSVASAEERQLGTHEWQVLLPVASTKQWAVKAGLVLSLALLLALGLPALLTWMNPGIDRFRWPQLAVAVIVITTVSLYVSSVCASGLWAMLMSLSAVSGVVLLFTYLRYRGSVMLGRGFNVGLIRLSSPLEVLLTAAFLALLLRFALMNHRSAERAAGRIWTQSLWIVGCLTAEILVAGLAAP